MGPVAVGHGPEGIIQLIPPAPGWGLASHIRVTVGTRERNERFLEALRLELRALGGGVA